MFTKEYSDGGESSQGQAREALQSHPNSEGESIELAMQCKVRMISIAGTVVKSEDVGFLMEHMLDYSYKWRWIGLSLRFRPGELENIRQSFPEKPTKYFLMELLSQWTQWPTTTHPHVPTMEKLCSALRSGLVGLGALANELYVLCTQLPSQ